MKRRPHVPTWVGLIGGIAFVCGWAMNGPAQTVYSDIVGVQRIDLKVGRNFVGIPFATDSNTVDEVFGITQLEAGGTDSEATIVEEWVQGTQSLGNRYWLSNAVGFEGWRNGFAPAGNTALDVDKGYVVTVRSNAVSMYVAGRVPETQQEQVLDKNGFSLVNSHFPVAISLSACGLVASGFQGGDNLVSSDNVLFYNPATGMFDQLVWYDSIEGVWKDPYGPTSRQLEPGEAFVVWRQNRASDVTWTNPVPYTLP